MQKPDVEMTFLGSILADNRIIDEMPVNMTLFEMPLCRQVWEEIQKARARGALADVAVVGMAMPNEASFVARLTDMASPANAAYYHGLLTEAARRRGLARLAREIGSMATDDNQDTDEIFTEIDRALLEISESRQSGYKPLSHFLAIAAAEIEAAFKSKGQLLGIPTGFPALDDKTNGWQRQALVVIGARPGAGKTSIALNMATAAIKKDIPVGFFSAEMSGSAISKRLVADWGQVEYKRVQSGVMGQDDLAKVYHAMEALVARTLHLNDQPSITLATLVSDARRMRRREHVGIIFVDYLSLIANKQRDIPRHEQVAEISATLKGLARELDIPVVVLSQLTREAQGERPKLSQLRDSGAVEQDADMVILLHNLGWTDDSHQYVKINLIIEKNRNGATGDLPMIFRPAMMRFAEVEKEWAAKEKTS